MLRALQLEWRYGSRDLSMYMTLAPLGTSTAFAPRRWRFRQAPLAMISPRWRCWCLPQSDAAPDRNPERAADARNRR
jgi:membrane carboxypeptidase/penicillin-binding protein PbpC